MSRRNRSERRSPSAVRVLTTALALWIVPISLMGYLSYLVANATGIKAFSFAPEITAGHVFTAAALAILAIGGTAFKIYETRRVSGQVAPEHR